MTIVEDKKSLQLRLQMLEARLHRQQKEIRRLESGQKLHKDLYKAIGAAVFILDPHHRILDINPAGCQLLGTSAEALLGQSCFTIMHCTDKAPQGCPLTAVVATKKYATGTMYVESLDRYLWVSCTPVFDDAGEVEQVIHIADDITVQVRMRDQLEASERQFRLLAENCEDIIWTLGADGRLIYVSPAVKRLLGFESRELVGQPLSRVLLPGAHEAAQSKLKLFFKRLKSGERDESPVRMELAHRCHDGRTVLTEVVVNKVFDRRGEFRFFIGISRDITERHRREEALQRANKLEAVGGLAGGLAHDFNNLLSIILGNLEMASEDLRSGRPADPYLDAAKSASLRARDLTHQLLAFAKGGDPVKQMTPLADVIKEALSCTTQKQNITPRVHLSPDLNPLAVDRLQMVTALSNIIQNAVEAMPHGGDLTIAAEPHSLSGRDAPPTLVSDGSPYIKLTITDQGCGISDEVRPRIFDPYFTTKPAGAQKGLGLGLALAYAVVKKHGGEIVVEAAPGEGSCFALLLPVGAEPTPRLAQSAAPATTQRILLMDDEEQLRILCEQMLTHLGYAVETVADGRSAVSAYKRAQDAGKPFGLVVLDLTVKSGMGGKDALVELQQFDPNVLAVVSSGYNEDPVMTDPQRYGFSGVLPKPYALKELTGVLGKVLPKALLPRAPA
jgi:PAS domain S-box-containing protein